MLLETIFANNSHIYIYKMIYLTSWRCSNIIQMSAIVYLLSMQIFYTSGE
jgi:hypothetical protein